MQEKRAATDNWRSIVPKNRITEKTNEEFAKWRPFASHRGSDPDHYIQPRNPCSDSQLESHGGDQHGCGLYGQFTNYDRRCASTILPRYFHRRGPGCDSPEFFAHM